MTIVDVLLLIVVIGLLLSLFNAIPLDYRMKQILYIAFVILLIIWLLGLIGVIPGGFGHRIG